MRVVVADAARHHALLSEYVDLAPTADFGGATCDGEVTAAGWDSHTWSTPVATVGRGPLEVAVFAMRVHTGAGLRMDASELPVRVGTTLLQSIGLGRLRLLVPTRVVRVVDEPERKGFAYATLPGHPEAGEEAFMVDQLADGSIRLRVTAVSRPGSRLVRWSGPLGGAAQAVAVRRYLRAARKVAVLAP